MELRAFVDTLTLGGGLEERVPVGGSIEVSAEFRQAAVEMVLETGKPAGRVSRELRMNRRGRWVTGSLRLPATLGKARRSGQRERTCGAGAAAAAGRPRS